MGKRHDGPVRGIFFDEEHARTVVRRLVRDGFAAELARERLAGEDDDEDHPWAVLTDAPELVLEMYVDEYEGWLDDDAPAATQPLPLPDAPKRIKRPGG